jgi:prepilin-type N-terminal cleavage/methylation domain-containing protein
MFSTLRPRLKDELGVTLIELLVVVLIIGILASVGIPALLNQRHKAYDAAAKTQIRQTAQAEEIYAQDHGTYISEAVGPNDVGPLATIEPTIKQSPDVTAAANGTAGYTLVSAAAGGGGDVFTYVETNGKITRTCSGSGGGCIAGSW